MKSSLIYGILAALITGFFMYLDSRLLDNPKTKATYWKDMLFVGLLVGGGIRLLGEEQFDQLMGFQYFNPGSNGGSYMNELGEEIMTGIPHF